MESSFTFFFVEPEVLSKNIFFLVLYVASLECFLKKFKKRVELCPRALFLPKNNCM